MAFFFAIDDHPCQGRKGNVLMQALLAATRANFLVQKWNEDHSLNRFILQKSNHPLCQLPLKYQNIEMVTTTGGSIPFEFDGQPHASYITRFTTTPSFLEYCIFEKDPSCPPYSEKDDFLDRYDPDDPFVGRKDLLSGDLALYRWLQRNNLFLTDGYRPKKWGPI